MPKTPEEIAAYKRAYYLANKHKWKESYHRCYSAEKNRPRCAKWRAKNLKKLSARTMAWQKANRDKVNAGARRRYHADPETACAKNRAKRKTPKYRKIARDYIAQRSERDINFRIKGVLRSRIQIAMRRRGLRKCIKTETLIGCTPEFLRGYLEARFLPGMTWDNYGTWHIDHHIPCAEFDLRDETQQRACFHFSNLRPLWGSDNCRKGAKRPPTHQAELI